LGKQRFGSTAGLQIAWFAVENILSFLRLFAAKNFVFHFPFLPVRLCVKFPLSAFRSGLRLPLFAFRFRISGRILICAFIGRRVWPA